MRLCTRFCHCRRNCRRRRHRFHFTNANMNILESIGNRFCFFFFSLSVSGAAVALVVVVAIFNQLNLNDIFFHLLFLRFSSLSFAIYLLQFDKIRNGASQSHCTCVRAPKYMKCVTI